MRKGQTGIDLLGFIAIGFVVATITLSVGAQVLSQLSVGAAGTYAADAVGNGTQAVANIATQLPIIGTIFALVVIIATLMMLRSKQ